MDGNLETKIVETIGLFRGLIMDGLEMKYGEEPSWQDTRKMVLKCLGSRGLEKRMIEIVSGENKND